MSDETFSFTPEQKAKLEKWKAYLDSEQAKQWALWEKEAIESFHSILKNARFSEGIDLSEEQLDDVFRNVRELINNQSLNRALCAKNGIASLSFLGILPRRTRNDLKMPVVIREIRG